jgi:hypothetical protein
MARRARKRVKPEWLRIGDAVRHLRRLGVKVSRRTLLRWVNAGAVTSMKLPGGKSWSSVKRDSLEEAARCWAR